VRGLRRRHRNIIYAQVFERQMFGDIVVGLLEFREYFSRHQIIEQLLKFIFQPLLLCDIGHGSAASRRQQL
jgi:hypothetical protein